MAAGSGAAGADGGSARARILEAAFATFSAQGYAQTSMLEIATRARVSKRELYALVGNKQDMLAACITERSGRMRPLADMPEPDDRASLAAALTAFGERLLREVSDPVVVGVFRLAIAEAERAPEIAQALDSIGRAAARKELAALLGTAQARGLLSGDPVEMTMRFLALLWGDLMLGLLLRLADPPTPEEAQRRAREAASAFLYLQSAEGVGWHLVRCQPNLR
ncbi:TetR family transcriptional regulator [Bosea sp. BK604]|nr:TetR/AcrR family transcriptional regulator [Bosea sp. BK604]TCR67013.1 TetR family transcriptional regulator [Bosea sp. BK604]